MFIYLFFISCAFFSFSVCLCVCLPIYLVALYSAACFLHCDFLWLWCVSVSMYCFVCFSNYSCFYLHSSLAFSILSALCAISHFCSPSLSLSLTFIWFLLIPMACRCETKSAYAIIPCYCHFPMAFQLAKPLSTASFFRISVSQNSEIRLTEHIGFDSMNNADNIHICL